MSKNQRNLALVAIGVVFLLVVLYFLRDLFLLSGRTVQCPDGPHPTIDLRDFITRYSAYSLEFETTIAGKGSLSGRLSPVQVESLSEAAQQANEFRKYVVAGYNSCAVLAADFSGYGARFQALDSLARQIAAFTGKEELDESASQQLSVLVDRYVELTRELAPR